MICSFDFYLADGKESGYNHAWASEILSPAPSLLKPNTGPGRAEPGFGLEAQPGTTLVVPVGGNFV